TSFDRRNEAEHQNISLVDTVDKAKQQEITRPAPWRGTAQSPLIRLLALSDLHFSHANQAVVWTDQLHEDLVTNLDVRRLDYLILAGDIADKSLPEEYGAAYSFVGEVAKRFGLDPERILVVPGNHDVNWEISKKSYHFEFDRPHGGVPE